MYVIKISMSHYFSIFLITSIMHITKFRWILCVYFSKGTQVSVKGDIYTRVIWVWYGDDTSVISGWYQSSSWMLSMRYVDDTDVVSGWHTCTCIVRLLRWKFIKAPANPSGNCTFCNIVRLFLVKWKSCKSMFSNN